MHPRFPQRTFVRDACLGLDKLELLDRGRHIAQALGEHLPPSSPQAMKTVASVVGPRTRDDELIGVGMAPFFYLPHTLFVAERGLEHFDLSMKAQYELTKRFSAEGSIRPYIARDPERAMTFLTTWATDEKPARVRGDAAPAAVGASCHVARSEPRACARIAGPIEGRSLHDGSAQCCEQPE